MNTSESDVKKLWDLIKHIEIGMLTTEDSGGVLRSRPMATQQISFDGVLWFFTESASHKVDEIHSHKNVNITFVDAESNRYISVSG